MTWRLGTSITSRLQEGIFIFRKLKCYEDINRAWESIKENIETSTTESLGLHDVKQHKPWFGEEWLGILCLRTFLIDVSLTFVTCMGGWKLSGNTFNCLVYCSSLNFSK
jgi:hypothetical protein